MSPTQSKKPRRCWRCGIAELSLVDVPREREPRRFKFRPSARGKGPECPPYTGCLDRARQYAFDLFVSCDEQVIPRGGYERAS